MNTPTLSFIVPCYKLAHLLGECIDSILAQSFRDFEILVMDDCSPDHTKEVAQSYRDDRVIYVKNDPNLGHLRNYNKGITMARGKYIWLISADDYLSKPYIAQRYVDLLDRNPKVGYVFCPGQGVGGKADGAISGWATFAQSRHGKKDRIYAGHEFLKELVKQNTIVAASGLVRRECYDQLGHFPLDMPYAGDWYLWCLFALHFDVGYLAEPMVCYRDHELNMTKAIWDNEVGTCSDQDVSIPWSIKEKADKAGFKKVSIYCLAGLSAIYARLVARKQYGMSRPMMTLEQFETSLAANSTSERERNWVRARVYAGIGNEYYWQGERALAEKFYSDSLRIEPLLLKVRAKLLFLLLGSKGDFLRKSLKRRPAIKPN